MKNALLASAALTALLLSASAMLAQTTTGAPGRGEAKETPATPKTYSTKPDNGRAERSGPATENADKPGSTEPKPASAGVSTNRAGPNPSGSDNGMHGKLDDRQQARLRDVVTRKDVARADHVDFDLKVGEHVPENAGYRPLPNEIISIVPQFQGFDYVVADNEILIIDPRTREIVTILPAGDDGRGRAPAHRARLDQRQERVVYQDVIRDARPVQLGMRATEGQRIPADVEILPLPKMVVDQLPDVRDYRYLVVDREVVLVDPGTREIVAVIGE